MKKIFYLFGFAVLVLCVSCETLKNDPLIDGTPGFTIDIPRQITQNEVVKCSFTFKDDRYAGMKYDWKTEDMNFNVCFMGSKTMSVYTGESIYKGKTHFESPTREIKFSANMTLEEVFIADFPPGEYYVFGVLYLKGNTSIDSDTVMVTVKPAPKNTPEKAGK